MRLDGLLATARAQRQLTTGVYAVHDPQHASVHHRLCTGWQRPADMGEHRDPQLRVAQRNLTVVRRADAIVSIAARLGEVLLLGGVGVGGALLIQAPVDLGADERGVREQLGDVVPDGAVCISPHH